MSAEPIVHGIDRVTQSHLCGIGPGLGTDAREPGMEITCPLCRVVMTMAAKPTSGWLADQRRAAKAAGLREAADDIETDWGPVWGGDGMWFTTGTAVAELVAGTLRSMAQEVES